MAVEERVRTAPGDEAGGWSSAEAIFKGLLERYAQANNSSDAPAYSKLFSSDAIWMPPGSPPVQGSEQIREAVQGYFDDALWTARFTPVDSLHIAQEWIYGVAEVDVEMTAHADGTKSRFRLTATWLLHKEPPGTWLITRQMWNEQGNKTTPDEPPRR